MIIRLPRKPRGVKLLAHDGRELPCKLVRDRGKDADGITRWRAVPTKPLSVNDFPMRLTAEMLPTRTSIYLDEEI